MIRKKLFSAGLLFAGTLALHAATLHVGAGQPYPTPSAAVAAVHPGDTIELHNGTYAGGLYFANLQGAPSQWITIRGAAGETAVFQGGSNAIHLSDPAWLHIKNLIFQGQTGNGFNTDDGGTYSSPAHHIIFEDCTFRNMAATGNNDLLKLSGLDDFEVRYCVFRNGAAGGSGIDMVGCHRGTIRNCTFENMGSNAIQAKGGTEHIRIEGNFFQNCGQRTLNLGGSTGLQFFRPDTAHFEAANLQIYANIITGSVAAVAYVGCVGVVVANNTIYQPEKWVLRILQETVDPARFIECGDNSFVNNIVVRNAGLSTETNIGPYTRPQTFAFSNNLWHHLSNPNWSGPNIPVTETNGIVNQDPLLTNPADGNFHLMSGSPAIGAGLTLPGPVLDFYGQGFAEPPSIGATEGMPVSGVGTLPDDSMIRIFPNPFSDRLQLDCKIAPEQCRLYVYDRRGHLLLSRQPEPILYESAAWPPGVYFICLEHIKTGKMYWQRVAKQ